MKITVTNGDEYLMSSHIELNAEGIRMRDEAYEQKKAAEEAARISEAKNNFQTTLDTAVQSLADATAPTVTTTTTPGSLDSYFEEASKTYGVDKQLLLAVARTESNFTANATSSAGAMGIMQLMPATAKAMGVSNAYDAKENIMGGAKLLSELLSKYNGDKSLALAAYNAGSGTVAKYGNTVPPSIQGYVDKVMGFYNQKVQAPDASTTTTTSTPSEAAQTAPTLRGELAKFPEYQSYDMFLEELAKEMSDEEIPSDQNAAYKLLLQNSKTAIDRVRSRLETESTES